MLRPLTIAALVASAALACSPAAFAQNPRLNNAEAPPGAELNTFRSRSIVLTTDLTEEESEALLEEAETMLALVAQYFGKPLRKPIPLMVWRDKEKWQGVPLPPEAKIKLAEGGGIMLSEWVGLTNRLTGQTRKTDSKAVAYAEAARGVPLHESVHAYCALTFGGTGPVWYSEGLAELGQYFRKGDVSVRIEPWALNHLKTAPRQTLRDILDTPRINPGGDWQAYTWRWALAHLLAYNPNYRERYRPLGVSLMSDGPLTFESVYGPMAPEITFEYDFFLDVLEQGVRPDLIAWDWKTKYRELRPGRRATVRLQADHGWQPGGIEVEEGALVNYEADGEWNVGHDRPRPAHATILDEDYEEPEPDAVAEETEPPPPVTAEGGADGRGRLVGAIFDPVNYTLSDEFELGAEGTFTAPAAGQLMLRCRDKWGQLDDNDGRMTVRLTGVNAN